MKFNSQIATSRVQSERLLSLGLKKETADMRYAEYYIGDNYDGPYTQYQLDVCPPLLDQDIPAWSLHRLIEMMPQYLYITRDKEEFYLDINNDGVMYDGVAMKLALVEFVECGNLYDNIIGCIAYLIKEEYFNKEYLK